MIELINVTKWFPTDFGRHYVFRDVSLKLPLDRSVGVVGPNGAGKSTFLRIIAGADTPNEGRVIRSGRISPPHGLTPSLLTSLTGAENARFACRIYGMDRDEMEDVVEKVGALASIGKYYDMPVNTYSAGMRQRVAFSISMMLKYDYYLFDEIGAGGDREFQETSKRMIQERLATSKFIITSHRIDELVELCQACIVVMNGELKYFDKFADGMEYYGERVDLSAVNHKIERKTIRKERQALIDSGQLPATREERRAYTKELRKRRAAERSEGARAAVVEAPGGSEPRSGRRRKSSQPPRVEQGAAVAAPTARPVLAPARRNLPMAPRVKLPPVQLDSEADRKIAQLRSQLAQRAGHEAGVERPSAPEPEGDAAAAFPDAAQAAREDRSLPRKLRRRPQASRLAADQLPETIRARSLGGIARLQENAAYRAQRATRLLLRLLDAGPAEGGGSGGEGSLSLTARAQEAAAAAAAKAAAKLLELASPDTEMEAPPPDTAAEPPSVSRRSKRRQARRQRRRADRIGADLAQPKTGTSR